MLKRFLIKYAKAWWAGLKVFCRWSAFWIVITVLCLPAMALTEFVENYIDYIIGIVLTVLIGPIVFFLTSKYLFLLGDEEQRVVESDGDSTHVAGKGNDGMGRIILLREPLALVIVISAFSIAAAIITPPDPVSQVFVIGEMIIIYGILIFILSRFKSFAQTPETIKKLIVALIYLLSITTSSSMTFFQYYYYLKSRAFRTGHFNGTAGGGEILSPLLLEII